LRFEPIDFDVEIGISAALAWGSSELVIRRQRAFRRSGAVKTREVSSLMDGNLIIRRGRG
jgi:hypothetical protein